MKPPFAPPPRPGIRLWLVACGLLALLVVTGFWSRRQRGWEAQDRSPISAVVPPQAPQAISDSPAAAVPAKPPVRDERSTFDAIPSKARSLVTLRQGEISAITIPRDLMDETLAHAEGEVTASGYEEPRIVATFGSEKTREVVERLLRKGGDLKSKVAPNRSSLKWQGQILRIKATLDTSDSVVVQMQEGEDGPRVNAVTSATDGGSILIRSSGEKPECMLIVMPHRKDGIATDR